MINKYVLALVAFVLAIIVIFMPAKHDIQTYNDVAYSDINRANDTVLFMELSDTKYKVKKALQQTGKLDIMPYEEKTTLDRELNNIWNRIGNMAYFQTMKAAFELALARILLVLALGLTLLPFILGVIMDAGIVRRLRFSHFAGRHPLLHKSVIASLWMFTFVAMGLFLLPWHLPSYALFAAGFLSLALMHTFIAQFHRYS